MRSTRWDSVPLSECVASVSAGVSVNSEDRPRGPGEIGVLKTSAISGGLFKSTENKIVVPGDRLRVAEPVRGGSVLFSRMNTPTLVGESCYVAFDDPSLFLPDRLWQIRVEPSRVDARWLAYTLQSPQVSAAIKALATGTSGSMKNIPKRSLLSFKVKRPSLREQQRIVEILVALDAQIRSTKKLFAKLIDLHESLSTALFPASDVKMVQLGDLVSKERPIVYGILMPGDHFPGGVPVVKVKDMKSGRIDAESLLLTRPSIDQEYRRSRLQVGDVLLSIRGTVGRICIVPAGLNGANITQDSARISLPPRISRYVAHYLASPVAQRFINSETVGLAVRGINLRDVRRIQIPLVSKDDAVIVADRLDASRALADQVALELLKLSSLKLGVMADLLSGSVLVPAEAIV